MRRAEFFAEAERDLLDLRRYLGRQSGSLRLASDFTGRLRARCDDIASLPGTLGKTRDDLGVSVRSIAWRDYVILFRYLDDRIQIIRILHGQRDLPAAVTPNDES